MLGLLWWSSFPVWLIRLQATQAFIPGSPYVQVVRHHHEQTVVTGVRPVSHRGARFGKRLHSTLLMDRPSCGLHYRRSFYRIAVGPLTPMHLHPPHLPYAHGLAVRQGESRRRHPPVRRFDLGPGALLQSNDGTEELTDMVMKRLTHKLKLDLPRQFDSPQDLSIFDESVEFQDPVTTLRGKLRYRGMLFATLLFFRVACKPGSPYFRVLEIDRPNWRTIRVVWETGAIAWNGRELFISGVDMFTVNDNGLISRHDSSWDQTWEQVRNQVIQGKEG